LWEYRHSLLLAVHVGCGVKWVAGDDDSVATVSAMLDGQTVTTAVNFTLWRGRTLQHHSDRLWVRLFLERPRAVEQGPPSKSLLCLAVSNDWDGIGVFGVDRRLLPCITWNSMYRSSCEVQQSPTYPSLSDCLDANGGAAASLSAFSSRKPPIVNG